MNFIFYIVGLLLMLLGYYELKQERFTAKHTLAHAESKAHFIIFLILTIISNQIVKSIGTIIVGFLLIILGFII
ncbi:hypothetical protein ACFO9Q_05580 [Paenibacillus sp. GCM10023252]|uniref:hypothetical protein n=1 Tax=Paenibacillus sp. GCM10023252 TaxID=3252649 RepID=UPI00360BAF23